jgi:hypothetical protein
MTIFHIISQNQDVKQKNYMFEVINKITGSVYKKNIPTAEEAIVCLNDARNNK